MSSDAYARVLRELAALRDEVEALKAPQLGRSSLENASIGVNDLDGNPVAQLGKQFDGTFGAVTLGGPKPPQPLPPALTTALGGVNVNVSGSFYPIAVDPTLAPTPAFAPMDFARFVIEVSSHLDFSEPVRRTEIVSADGGNVLVPWVPTGTTLFARVACRSLAGKTSDWSPASGPAASGQIGVSDLGFDLSEIGGSTIHPGSVEEPSPPAGGHKIGDLWLAIMDPGPPPQYESRQWDGNAWQPLNNQKVTQALLDAFAAQQAAQEASSAAATAQEAADLAASVAQTAVNDAATAYQLAEQAEATGSTATGAAAVAQQAADDAAAAAQTALQEAQAAGTNLTAVQQAAEDARTAADAAQLAADAAGTAAAQADADAADAAADAAEALANAAAASTAASNAQTTANTKTRVYRQATQPPTTGRTIGDEWINTSLETRPDGTTGPKNSRWLWTGAWTETKLGGTAIQPKSLVLSDLAVTGTITAALLETIMILASTIILGDPNGIHTRLSPEGFRVFRGDVNGDGIPDESLRAGVAGESDRFATVRADGTLGFVADEDGYVTAAGLSVEQEPRIGAPDYSGRGGNLYEILDRRPRGIVSWNTDNGIFDCNTGTGRGTFDIGAKLEYGRMYKIIVRCRLNGTVHNDALAELQIRYTQTDQTSGGDFAGTPAAPTVQSQMAGRFHASIARSEAQGVYFEKLFSYGPGVPGDYRNARFLLCLARPVGGTTIQINGTGETDAAEMWIEDIGPYTRHAGTRNDGGGTSTNPGPAPAPQKTRYNRTWVCNWRQNWNNVNAPIDIADAYQGLDPSGNYGNMKSYLGFSGVATDGSGLTMQQALAGADIEEIGLFLFYEHWYAYAGGEAVIGMHGYEHPAPSYGGGNEWMHGEPGWRRNEGRWISLGRYFPQNWATGVWKGIMLGGVAAADFQHYGRAHAEGSATLNITYWR